MKNPARFWDRIAERYARSPVRDPQAYEATLERVRAHLPDGGSVLELGCGTGSTALALAGSVASYTASDVSAAMIAIARRKAAAGAAQNIAFEVADISTAPIGPFDAVLAFNLLHLIRDMEAALAQIHARVRPGGLFISKTFCRPETAGPWRYRMMRAALPVMQAIGKAPYVSFMTITQLEQTVTRAGFTIVESGNYPETPPSRLLVARRD